MSLLFFPRMPANEKQKFLLTFVSKCDKMVILHERKRGNRHGRKIEQENHCSQSKSTS